jgi:hypothetical protein
MIKVLIFLSKTTSVVFLLRRYSLKFKTKLLAAIAATTVLLSGAGYFGYHSFKKNYVLLDKNDIASLEEGIVKQMERAYEMGLYACNKSS